jgi:MFS family permease
MDVPSMETVLRRSSGKITTISLLTDRRLTLLRRFPVAFQIPMLIGLMAGVLLMPESPRWLTKMGRKDEARYVLGRLRGDEGEDQERAEIEFQDIVKSCELERKELANQSYGHMLFGIGSGKLHTGRRVQLVIWLQIMQEWVGIAGVTIYAPTIFGIAGMSPSKRQWIAGLNNIFYMFSTLICVFTLDRIGRRWTCYWGSVGQGIAMALAGGFSYLGQQATLDGDVSKAAGYGNAAVSMVFLFTFVFGATWLTVPWLYPAEIFPLEVRAKGNAWGVVGWSIGNGWLTLLCPIMFDKIGEKTLYIFAACNAITIPMVWALYPETNQRTLEEIDLLFASDSIWNWEAEKNFARLRDENGLGATTATARDIENVSSRKPSVAQDKQVQVESVQS